MLFHAVLNVLEYRASAAWLVHMHPECTGYSTTTQHHCFMISTLYKLLLLTSPAFYPFILFTSSSSSSLVFSLTNLSHCHFTVLYVWLLPFLRCPSSLLFIPALSSGLSALLLPLRILLLLCLRQTNFLTSKAFFPRCLHFVMFFFFGLAAAAPIKTKNAEKWEFMHALQKIADFLSDKFLERSSSLIPAWTCVTHSNRTGSDHNILLLQ